MRVAAEFAFALVAAGPAGRAFEPRGQRLGIGEEGDPLPADGHLADRDRFASVGGDAGLQHGPIIRDGGEALELRRGRWREGAVGRLGCAGKAGPGGKREDEKANKAGKAKSRTGVPF